jgi:hypothetical protein
MATKVVFDYRRTDLRSNVLTNPYWISSGIISGADDIKGKHAVLFSFPKVEQILITAVCFQIITAFTAGTTFTLGNNTLATDDVTTGGDCTDVDVDSYMLAADITIGTPGFYWPIIATASAFSAALAAGSDFIAPCLLVGAAATVPCITAVAANGGAIAAGAARVHMQITKLS